MKPIAASPTKLPDLAWLLDVTESRQPLSDGSPVWVRHGVIRSGPPVPRPERHPYCELGIILEGEGISFVQGEQMRRRAGDLLLIGPGAPHWGRIERFPQRFITVYFLPTVAIDMGPESDGARVLRRFTVQQPLGDRIVRLPKPMLRQTIARLEEMVDEFERPRLGREIRLRTLLMEQIVALLRWEEAEGRSIGSGRLEVDWRPITRTLGYLREHYAEPIYARTLARVAGVSESRLNALFHGALGISWVKYLQGCRIHRAAALLNESDHNVTEAALAVGFECLSHFNAVFRRYMGVPPKKYLGAISERRPGQRAQSGGESG